MAFALTLGGFASTAQAQFASPEALVRELYGYYGSARRVFPMDDYQTTRRFLDRSMSILWRNSSNRLSYDFFVQRQDWKLSGLKISKGQLKGQTQSVIAQFRNFNENVRLVYVLVRNADGWRIFDVESEK